MKTTAVVKQIFSEFSNKVGSLTESDLSNIAGGTHEFVITVAKKRVPRKCIVELAENHKKEILKELNKCRSREEGSLILTDFIETKNELEQFARFLDVHVLKADKADQVKEKIIEATVGAILRSEAIQGKNK